MEKPTVEEVRMGEVWHTHLPMRVSTGISRFDGEAQADRLANEFGVQCEWRSSEDRGEEGVGELWIISMSSLYHEAVRTEMCFAVYREALLLGEEMWGPGQPTQRAPRLSYQTNGGLCPFYTKEECQRLKHGGVRNAPETFLIEVAASQGFEAALEKVKKEFERPILPQICLLADLSLHDRGTGRKLPLYLQPPCLKVGGVNEEEGPALRDVPLFHVNVNMYARALGTSLTKLESVRIGDYDKNTNEKLDEDRGMEEFTLRVPVDKLFFGHRTEFCQKENPYLQCRLHKVLPILRNLAWLNVRG